MPSAAPSVRDLRRAEIVDAARKLVADGGIEALTFGKLERSVSFTRGVITYHFENRDEIVAAVLDSAIREIDGATRDDVSASSDLASQVRAVLRSKVNGFLDHPEAARILLSFWARAHHDPKARRVNQELFRVYRTQARSLSAGPNADAFATLMVGTVIGIVTQKQLDPDRVDAESAIDEAADALAARLERQ
ncbi:MAG: TetR family transcriptional regulator C-terminal domain-containing protein [Proteobacteria bacterium]|nr:TetR family transcriptional regulator C-terminal domain-containing protein [Pseudomonadota bacterium]